MDRNAVILDGQHKPPEGATASKSTRRTTSGSKTSRSRNFDRPRRRPRRQRDLVERRRGLEQNRRPRLVGPLPDRVRHGAQRRLRHLHQQRDPSANGTTSTRPASTTRASTSAPARNARPRSTTHDGRQRARLLGLELRRQPGDRKLDVHATTPTGSPRTPKTRVTVRRRRTAPAAARHVRPPEPTPTISSTESRAARSSAKTWSTKTTTSTRPTTGRPRRAPWGVGIELPGDYADLVEDNTIKNNPTNGVLAFEYPNPFPPTEEHDLLPARREQDRQQHVLRQRLPEHGLLAAT